jgi:hypothetical protein
MNHLAPEIVSGDTRVWQSEKADTMSGFLCRISMLHRNERTDHVVDPAGHTFHRVDNIQADAHPLPDATFPPKESLKAI